MNREGAILIAGAGPTGLTAALELARRGAQVRIIDRKDGPTPLSKAVGISSHSLDLLALSGAADRLLAEGICLRAVHVRLAETEGELVSLDMARIPHRYAFLLALPQSRTETILCDLLAAYGVSVEWDTRLCGMRQDGDGAVALIDGPGGQAEAPCAALFGADGVRSTVRAAAGIAFPGRDHQRVWSIADAELADWPHAPDAAQLFFHPGGNVGFIVPIGEGRFRAVSNTPDAMASIPGPYRVRRVLRADTFKISSRCAEVFRAGAVFLGGDAAHVHSPVGARGMNLGIEDGACFARRWAEGALDGYSAERRPVAQRWIARSEAILSGAQAAGGPRAAIRNLALRTVAHVPAVQRMLLSRMAGLKE